MTRRSSFLLVLVFLALTADVFGHGGGLDRNGCHTNRKTGDYHCHGAPAPPPAPAPSTPASSSQPATSPIRRASAQALTAQEDTETRERHMVRSAQILLRALGYRPSLLGSLDERTKVAVREFQRAESLEPDGTITAYLIVRLAEKVASKCE